MDADQIFAGEGDLDAARALVASTADAELFLYPGEQHLFADNGLPSYDAERRRAADGAGARLPRPPVTAPGLVAGGPARWRRSAGGALGR